ncbi:MAG: hypothetical protein FJ202_09390, partial [Gemmatimonadetes bacterium]|nr:hypothetical protein [Gemmatimonadota bacterium]
MNGSSPHGPLALRAVAAAAVSAAAALVAPLVVPLGAQATAVVNGTLVLGSGPNATALAGQWVVLHRIARDRAGPVDSVRTSVRGAFSVSIPRGDSAAAWMASAERGGVAYFTTLSAANQPVTLSVFDTTSRAIPLRVAGRQIAIAGPAADGSRHVVEALALANDSTVTRIPRDSLPLFVIQVPEVAEQLAIGAGSEVDVPAARLTGPTIALHAAIPPGAKRIVWEYRLPPGHSEFRIAGAQPTASLDLVVADSGATVTGGDMHQGSATVIGGEPALRFFADEVPDPSAIVVRFAATRASTLAFDVGVIGVALILVVGVAIAVLLGRSPGARAAARDASRRAGQVAGACLVAFTFACGEAPRAGGAGASGSAAAITDDYGDTIRVVAAGAATAAQRIVSLNPVATELLFAAGVGARVVGRTRWDMYPSEARAVPDLGDGINPN